MGEETQVGLVYTIGYSNGDFDSLMDRMRPHGITHLVDVRTNPYSRYQTDFRGEEFARRIRAEGLQYIFMGDKVGGKPTDASITDETGVIDPMKLREAPYFQLGVAKIVEAAQNPQRKIMLMCGCARPEQCHRGRVLCESLLDDGVESNHVLVDGSVVTQTELRKILDGYQPSLFS